MADKSCRGSLESAEGSFFTEDRKEVQRLCQEGYKEIALASLECAEGRCRSSVRDSYRVFFLFRKCRRDCRGAEVLSGSADKSCSGYLGSAEGNFRANRSYLCFARKGRKKLGVLFSGRTEVSWRDSVREGRKRSCKGFLSGVLSLEAKPTRKTVRFLR
jgi:hypothetical protein